MNKKNSLLVRLPFLVALAVPVFITACGESSNLDDPKDITSTTECSDLETSDGSVVCVPGYFVDDAVANLNYSCDKVNAVTNAAGKFTCPAGSTVEFSLLNPEDSSSSAKKITFGKLTVKNLPKYGSKDAAIYVSPADFGAAYANNVVRLLQALRATDAENDEEMASRKVVILDDDKKELSHLAASVTAADFALSANDFDALIQSFIDATGITMPLPAQANTFLKKAIHSTVAGVYYAPGYPISYGYSTGSESWDGDYGVIRGIKSDGEYFLAATWNMVDRKGRVTGFGVYSTGPGSLSGVPQAEYDNCKILLPLSCEHQPPRNLMRLVNDSGKLWTDFIADGSWRLSYNLTDNAGSVIPSSLFSFTQGVMDRGAIAGTKFIYKKIFDVTLQSSEMDKVGRWQLTGSPGFSAADTSFTLARIRAVAPTLEPGVWNLDKLSFPLDMKLTFLQSDKVTQLATLRILILKDGNIVSNIHEQCGHDLDLTTLKYPDGDAEFPLGTVAQAFKSNDNEGKRVYLTPMIIVPDDAAFPAVIRNAQIGTADAAGSVRLRADQLNASTYLNIYDDNDFVDGYADDKPRSAQWYNAATLLKLGSSAAATASGFLISQDDTCIAPL